MFTANKETGMLIEEVNSFEEGEMKIAEYEKADKKEGNYEENWYNIVDENHCNIER
jgi:hypothetical protein